MESDPRPSPRSDGGVPPGPDAVCQRGALRVLLVEDERDHADLVAAYLSEVEDFDLDLTHVSSVGRALDSLASARAAGHPFQVVLCDQRLPDSEYWESVSRVVGAAGDAPVVALTSIGDMDIAVDAMRQGAQDYLVKSELTPEVLRRTVRYAVERARQAAELRALNDTLESRVREQSVRLRALSARLATAEQEERRRIAQLLHDDLQQRLHGLSITLDLIARAPSEDVRARMTERASQMLGEATELTRTLATDLNPAALGAAALGRALRWLAARTHAAHGLDVDVEGDANVLDPTLRALLYHLTRELLFNVAKHAGTGRARIVVSESADAVVVCVEDEGRGFDATALDAGGVGFGLASVRERLESAGGHLAIESAPGVGTRIALTVPVAIEAAEAVGD